MKLSFIFSLAGISTAVLLTGCSKSEPAPNPTSEAAAAAPAPVPAPETVIKTTPTPAPVPAAVTPPSAPALAPAVQTIANDLFQQLTASAKAKSDDVLASVSTDLVGKAKALAGSLAANAAVQGYVDSTLQSLLGDNPIAALGSLQKLADAKLTSEQTKLLGDVKNLVSAYIVQDNFAGLAGSQSDVAKIVNSLRQGEVVAAVSSLQKVAQNANLTSGQKNLLSAIADKYAPGLAGAAKSVSEGLKGLKLGK